MVGLSGSWTMKDTPKKYHERFTKIVTSRTSKHAFGKGKILATEKNYEILINTP
jgi:hypothetical protein